MFIETHGLTKRYAEMTALEDCSLGIQQGEVFGLLGPNGAGKTTLLRLLLGFLKPTAGWARIDGLDCHCQSVKVHERTAYLPGDVQLFRTMRGRDVLQFFAEMRGTDVRQSQALAARLDLDLSRGVSAMSTGMRQKLALVATLAGATPLVVLDEPTANLDPSVRSEVARLVRETQQAGRTVLFSSHVLSEVEEVCDRVVILRRGRLVHTQGMAELRKRHRITAELTGTLPSPPPELAEQIAVQSRADGIVSMETAGELSPVLGWLGTLPLRDVRIEPAGIRAVYERFHAEGAAT